MIVDCAIGDSSYATIADNDLTTEDPDMNGFAIGLAMQAGDFAGIACPFRNSLVTRNHIHIVNGIVATDIIAVSIAGGEGRVFGNVISRNTYSGNSVFGMLLEGFRDEAVPPETLVEVTNNAVLRNNFKDLETVVNDVSLDAFTNNNFVIVREGDVVVDEGVDNLIRVE